MKKFFTALKWTLRTVLLIALVFAGMRVYPLVKGLFHWNARVAIQSTVLSEQMTEMGFLETVSQNETGAAVVETPALFIGVVQRVEIPYSYTIAYGVDLTRATVEIVENRLTIGLPAPEVAHHKLDVTGEVKKIDFLYPLTAERYGEMLAEQEQTLTDKYAQDAQLLERAWQLASERVLKLVSILSDGTDSDYEIALVKIS